tara:strand:+ start:1444 stop:2193 length:750 start_codon:yes stop_codon:yes gene_type:complete
LIEVIFLIFVSASWATVKWVDERTDSKLVFFLPAGILMAFLLVNASDSILYLVFTCLTAPIITMLVVVGIQQGNPLFLKEPNRTPAHRQTLTRRQPSLDRSPRRDLDRRLAPSYVRAYDRLIGYVKANGGEIKSRQEGIERLENLGIDSAEIFFSSPYVLKVLGFENDRLVNEENKAHDQESIGDGWWEKDRHVGNQIESSSSTENGELCGHPGCGKPVGPFDFRCYTCRGRFCPQHVGPNINCQLCSN